MSIVSENARLSMTLADFAQNGGGKLNMLGGNIQVIAFDPNKRVTARFALVAQIELDSLFCPADFTVEISLVDADGNAVPMPGQSGESGKLLRIKQTSRIERPAIRGQASLPASIPGQTGVVIDFGNGVPLKPGAAYAWQLRIDDDTENAVLARFFVLGPPQGPVFG